jgi:polyhydroxyalkanoate synthesis regulator phasin
MDQPQDPVRKGGLTIFASWLLLHEKADDWIRDAIRRARETPEDMRQEYQAFLLEVESEKEALKALLADAVANEFRQLGFLHRDETADLTAELDELRRRIRGLEDRLERMTSRAP